MTTHDSEPGSEAQPAAPIAVDPRLVAELGFALRLSRPAPWLRSLLALGRVVDDLLPLMGDWMTRWSSALSYDDTEAPLVHARWTQPEAEAGAPAPTPTVRAQAPAAQASHSVHIRERIRETAVHHPAQAVSSAPTAAPRADGGARPVVRAVTRPATPESGAAADRGHPRAGRTRVIEGPPVARTGPDPMAAPARPAPTAPSSDARPGPSPAAAPVPTSDRAAERAEARADAPAMPTAATVHPVTRGEAPTGSTATPAPSVAASEPATAERPVATAAEAPTTRPVSRAHPAAPPAPVDLEALKAAAEQGARVVTRGVRRGRPDGRPVPAAPTPIPADVARVHPAAPAAQAARVALASQATQATPFPQATHAAQSAQTPPDAPSPAAPAARPVVQARAVDGWSGVEQPVIRARSAGRAPVPSVRGASPQMPGAPTPSHAVTPPVVVPSAAASRGPSPGPAPAAPRMVPMHAPGSADEVARALGLPPGVRPSSPPRPGPSGPQASQAGPQAGSQPALLPHSRAVVLDAGQIRSIAGVVQAQVVRQMERERARTRTRV